MVQRRTSKEEVNGKLRIISILKHKDIGLDYLATQIEDWMVQQSQVDETMQQQDPVTGEPGRLLPNHEDENEQIVDPVQEDKAMEMIRISKPSSEQTELQRSRRD